MWKRIWPYVALIHPYPVLMVVLATLGISLLAAGGRPEPGTLARLAGMILLSQICVGITNELHDLPLDRLSRPAKPLVSGAARPGPAAVIAWGSCAGSLGLGWGFGSLGLLYALLCTAAGLVYNYWLKGTALSWLPYALGFSLLPVWPFVALGRPGPSLATIVAVVLPASVALNLAQSLPDIESDGAQGVRSLAQRLGRRRVLPALWLACLLAIAMAIVTSLGAARPTPLLLACAVDLLLLGAMAARCQLRPGPKSWALTWKVVAAAMALLAVGWFAAVL
jgi:4-hydroxybenzoate polyprenyltransferase